MALEKVTVIDKIEILEEGVLQVRRATYIVEDGKRLGNAIALNREVYEPVVSEDRMAKEDKRVQDVAALVWTPEVIVAAQAKEEARAARQAALDAAIAEANARANEATRATPAAAPRRKRATKRPR